MHIYQKNSNLSPFYIEYRLTKYIKWKGNLARLPPPPLLQPKWSTYAPVPELCIQGQRLMEASLKCVSSGKPEEGWRKEGKK